MVEVLLPRGTYGNELGWCQRVGQVCGYCPVTAYCMKLVWVGVPSMALSKTAQRGLLILKLPFPLSFPVTFQWPLGLLCRDPLLSPRKAQTWHSAGIAPFPSALSRKRLSGLA